MKNLLNTTALQVGLPFRLNMGRLRFQFRLQKNRHTCHTKSMCLRCLSEHFWLIHFRKMSNPPPRLLSLIEVFERRTVPPAMEQPTKRKAITLSKIRFILPLFTISLLSFFKTYIFIISKTLQFTKRFRKIFKKFNGRDWSLRAGACNRAVGASTHKLFKFACADISHRKHTFNGCFHIFIC